MDEPVPSSEYYQLELPYKPSSASVYWKKITIPKGLPSLLETFVRETIRENPDDTYKFLAELSETLLAKRAAEEQEAEQAANFKKEKQAADEESPLLDSKLPIPTSYKIEDQKEEKEPVAKEEVESVTSSSISPTTSSPPPAVVEQDDDAACASPSSSALLAEETAAATKIQSQFRGFKTRKELREQVQQQKSQEQPGSPTTTTPTSPTAEEAEPEEAIVPEAEQTENNENEIDNEIISASSPQPEEIAAATKIQSQFRGFKTRKELREQLNPNKEEDLKSNSPTIPEEEVILEAVTIAPVTSAPPPPEEVSTSPTGNSLEKEVDDEEIAAAINIPLETIREESFDHSSSAPQPAIPSASSPTSPAAAVDEGDGDADAKSGAENEAGKEDQDSVLVEENEESTSSPDGDDVIIINGNEKEEENADKGVLEKEESIEVDIERSSSKPNSATSQGRSYQVEAVSNEDISAALAALADSSESGDDPSLRKAGGTKGPTSSNDIDNKNDEMPHESSSPTGSVGGEILSSSSQDKNDDAKDEIPVAVADENSAQGQNGDQPSETAGLEKGEEEEEGGEVQPTEPISSPQPQPITDNEDGIPPHENPESTTNDAPVPPVVDGGDGVEDKAEETQNVLPPPQEGDDDVDNVPQQDSNEEEALGVINLSSDDGALVISDTANVSEADQTPICAEGESDKNKKSDVADDDGDDDLVAAPDKDDAVGMQNIENAEVETNAEKNTENITDTAPQFTTTDGEQPEVGQPVEEVGVGDDAEKTESNQLQQSPSALTSESSVDREDTDIATPTDFSAAEEKEELNLDELKKFASNFEEESQEFGDQQENNNGMEAVSSTVVEEAGVVEPEIIKTVAPVRNQQPSQEESTTSGETASSGDAGVLQVEIKSSEPPSPAPAAEGDASSKPASPEATATVEVADTVASPTPSTEQKSEESATTPEVASPTPVEEAKPAGAETPITSPAPAGTPESVASPPPEIASPQPEAVASPTADEAKSPEPPVPILRPGSGESQSAEQVASPTPAEEKPAETVASPPPVESPTPTESPKSPEPAASPESAKSPEPASPEAAKSPEPAASPEAAKSPEPASPEAAKSPEPAVSPESVKSPEPASAESPKSPEPTPTESAKSPEPASPESVKSPEPSPLEAAKSPEPAVSSPAPTDSPQEPQSPPAAASPSASEPELQKTEAASPITSPPPSAAATPAPEQITPSPPPVSESPTTTTQETAIPANSSPTSPEPSSTTTTTNQPEKSDTETTTNQMPTSAAAGAEQPESKQEGEKKAIGTVVLEEKRKESIEPVTKQEKPPVVKRRLGWDKQQAPRPPATTPTFDAPVKKEEDAVKEEGDSSSLAAQVEIASSASISPTESSLHLPSPTDSPVLRRSKPGSGRNRSRAATNKYRSGLVIEQGISMDEMEKEIENEMMNSAATKIQAGFRGFQTRKSITGVSKKGKGTAAALVAAKPCDPQDQSAAIIPAAPVSTAAEAEKNKEAAATARLSPVEFFSKDAECVALNAAIIAAAASRGGKPPLSCLRSRSYPGSHGGSHEDEHPILEFDESDEDLLFHPEPEIDLELDPDYINRAATKIQANFRGYRVRKSFKRPAGKEHNGDKSLLKSQKLAEADKAAEERAKVMETHERLQQRDEDELCYEDFDAPAEPEKAAAKIQASFRSYKERQRFHRKKKAAITIQASIRGFLTRKRLANMRRRSFQRRRSSAKAFHKELEEIKKVNEAATKIQAVFRGYKVRSKMPRSSMINEQEQFIDE